MNTSAFISIRGARLHNLKYLNLDIPKNQLVVLTGVSGSGKSTLGFDLLYKEGARQYLESLGLAAAGFSKPPVDSIHGLSPTISVDQRQGNHSPRSTVGTASEVYTYLRILFARLGRRPCPHCGLEIVPIYEEPAGGLPGEAYPLDESDETPLLAGQEATFPCPHCRQPAPELGMEHFSFNKPAGACPTCSGLGVVRQANLPRLVDEALSINGGAVAGWDTRYIRYNGRILQAAARHYGLDFDLDTPLRDLPPALRDLLYYGVESVEFRRHYPFIEPPKAVNRGRFEGVANTILRRYAERVTESAYLEKIDPYLVTLTCPACHGARLRPASQAVTVAGRDIVSLARLPLNELAEWLNRLPERLDDTEQIIAQPLLADIDERLAHLLEVGLGYLCLERSSPSISAGEAQRLRLAALLGSGLTGVLYILDEPTIGLHPRDTQRLAGFLRRLRDLGNTVLVIEHDLEMMRLADTLIDLGPGGGKAGGQVVALGSPDEVARQRTSLTGAYLAGIKQVARPAVRRKPGEKHLSIRKARHNNLQAIDVRIPLGLLVAVTGVSGSGKSSLVFDILDRAARQRFYQASDPPGAHDRIEGWEHLDKVITIDQQQLGRLPRSNAATYSDAYTPIREAYAATAVARELNFAARHFSFNVPGGRCERCQGAGVLAIQMHFLPTMQVRCPACQGRRFTAKVLSVQYHGLNIAQALELTVDEALRVFEKLPPVVARLQVMADVGLGYLQLGQPANTLSGGEAQRVKLARELGRRDRGRALYLLDEPTTGLHPADVDRLLAVLQRLVDSGNSVLVVEHNLDVMCAADWIIDLGPEGGSGGGRIVAEGPPEQVAQVGESHTGQFLRRVL